MWKRGDVRRLWRNVTSISSPFATADNFDVNLEVLGRSGWLDKLMDVPDILESAIWEHTFKCTADAKYIYRNGAPTLAKAAESEFVSALEKAGIVAKSRVPDEDYEPTPAKRERWEQALMPRSHY